MSVISATGYNMAENTISDFNGINTYTNPFNTADGNIIHCVNLDSDTNGSRVKRGGYDPFLGTPDNEQVNSLFSWLKNDGTTLFLYRASGSSLYYSAQGTGDWTICGGGTISDGAHVTSAVLDDNMIIGDGVGSMKYTTTGTSFTAINYAPIGGHDPVEYQGRIYALGAGTNSSHDFYSVTGTINDWDPAGDSDSILVGGAGNLLTQYKASDRLLTCKNSGKQHRWDGDSLVDTATKLGPSSPYCVGNIEDYRFWLNEQGIYISNADKPQLISNPISRQISNHSRTGIVASTFKTIVAGAHGYDYCISAGTVTDDFTGITIPDAVINYDYKHNEFINYVYYNFPTAYHSFIDIDGEPTFIFGDATGQVYEFGDEFFTDNGHPIDAELEMILHGNNPHMRKDFKYIEFYASPGCGASVSFAVVDVIKRGTDWIIEGSKIWKTLGDLHDGYTMFRFPPEARGRLMYLKIDESGQQPPWQLYSIHYTWDEIPL
jgi:hypothetical protein